MSDITVFISVQSTNVSSFLQVSQTEKGGCPNQNFPTDIILN